MALWFTYLNVEKAYLGIQCTDPLTLYAQVGFFYIVVVVSFYFLVI